MGRSDKHEKSQYKKSHHGKLGEVVDKRKMNKDEERDIRDAIDPLYWENYCGACDYFETEDCPHLGHVTNITRWQDDVNCKNFND